MAKGHNKAVRHNCVTAFDVVNSAVSVFALEDDSATFRAVV